MPTVSSNSAKAAQLGDLPEWDLRDLYPATDSAELASDLARAEAECRDFVAAYHGKVAELAGEGGAELARAIERFERIEDLLGRLMAYASLVYVGDTTDSLRAKFYGDMNDKLTTISSQLLFFTLELNKTPDELLDAAMANGPLRRWRPWIEDTRREKPHQLDDRLEQLFHEKSLTCAGAWNRLFDETIAALRFTVGDCELTLEPTLNLLQDQDEKTRKSAAEALSQTLRRNLKTFALIINTLAKDKEISDRWRGFADVADARHLSNRVERETVEALVASVRAAYPRLSHRYYRLKASWFGKRRLPFWDRNAPLPDGAVRSYSWDDARHLVLDAFGGFAPNMEEIARRFFERRWIDAPVRPGKAPGAFAHPTTPSAHPYVLVNFLGKPRDVMTLAHELGHGVHQVLAAPNGALLAQTPLTLAETASVFGEMLTFQAMLARTSDPAQRKSLLAGKVEDMLNTVVRQIAFYSFERALHLARREGELTPEKICAIWMDVQAECLGPAIELSQDYEPFWAYIPHFIHSPFYVYAYAFGDCLVNSLYGLYRQSDTGFVDKYFALLSAGGSRNYTDLLAPFGLDARDPSFWNIGLAMIDELIGELERLDAPAVSK